MSGWVLFLFVFCLFLTEWEEYWKPACVGGQVDHEFHVRQLVSSDTTDVLDWIIVVEAFLVHRRIFSSVPGLYSLDASNTPLYQM